MSTKKIFVPKDYKADVHPIWCPGCGDFGVLTSLYNAFAAMNLDPDNLVVVSGIGCSGRTPGFIKSYGFHAIHGRVLPIALGVKLANPKLEVIAVGGDGDGFAIGGGHIPHAARRNPDIAYIIMDNSTYGLTKGSYSPTSPAGFVAGSTPYGSQEPAINPLAMLIAYGTSWVGQGYSGKMKQLTELTIRAIKHKGFAFLNIISPCIVFNNIYKTVPQKLAIVPEDHDVTDQEKAFGLALKTDQIITGVLYEKPRTTFEDAAEQTMKLARERGPSELDAIINQFSQ